MQNTHANSTFKKQHLILCELYHPIIHGFTTDSNPNITSHYIVYGKYDPSSLFRLSQINDDTDSEYDDDDDDEDEDNIYLGKIDIGLSCIRSLYNYLLRTPRRLLEHSHPVIRNYKNIILHQNYIKPEIAECIVLPTQETIAILKTFWIRIIQKKWKKIFKQRQEVIKKRHYLSNIKIREIKGNWSCGCMIMPTLKGMLANMN